MARIGLGSITGKKRFSHNARTSESEKWFIDTVNRLTRKGKRATSVWVETKKRRTLTSGQLVIFRYPNPKTPMKQLKWFDMHPMVLILEKKNSHGNLFGVNLHYMPRPMREKFLIWVLKKNRNAIKGDKRITMDYETVLGFLKPFGMHKIALHQYIPARVASAEVISYSNWKKVVELRSEKFVFDGKYSMTDVLRIAARG